jgi:hypothetical protein
MSKIRQESPAAMATHGHLCRGGHSTEYSMSQRVAGFTAPMSNPGAAIRRLAIIRARPSCRVGGSATWNLKLRP